VKHGILEKAHPPKASVQPYKLEQRQIQLILDKRIEVVGIVSLYFIHQINASFLFQSANDTKCAPDHVETGLRGIPAGLVFSFFTAAAAKIGRFVAPTLN
jgi:hypothetical protein